MSLDRFFQTQVCSAVVSFLVRHGDSKFKSLGSAKNTKGAMWDWKVVHIFFGLPFLHCFAEDLMSDLPNDQWCTSWDVFEDYVLENYIVSDSSFHQHYGHSYHRWMQDILPMEQSFHAHYNEQFYAAHPTIFCIFGCNHQYTNNNIHHDEDIKHTSSCQTIWDG